MRSIRCAFVLIALFCQSFSYADVRGLPEIPLTKKEELSRNLIEIAKKYQLVGLQILVNHKNGKLLNIEHGLASIEDSKRVEQNSIFRVGSISKTIAAIAIMQLVESKQLSLHMPVRSIIPEIFIDNPWSEKFPITIVHLLEHTAGFDDIHFREYGVDGSEMSTKEALDFFPNTRTARYQPGLFTSYTNIGPTIIAYLIEKISGLSYEDYVQQHIFAPLGVKDASFHLSQKVNDTLVSGYITNKNENTLVAYQHIKDRASGALNASAAELSKIQRMLLGYIEKGSANILTYQSIQKMSITETTLAAKEGYQIGYGKYLITELTDGVEWIGHSGEMIGYQSEMWHSKELELGFVLLTNSSGNKTKEGVQEIKQALKSFFVNNVETETLKELVHGFSGKEVINYEEITGSYRLFTSRLSRLAFFEILESFSSVFVEKGLLKLKTPHSTYTLEPIGGHVFRTRSTEGHEIDIVFSQANNIWYYQVPALMVNAVNTSSFTKPISFALLIAFFSTTLIIAFTLVVQFFRRYTNSSVEKVASLKWYMLSPLCLVAVIICLGSAGSTGMPLLVLGQVSVQSVGVTVGLILFLCSSITAHYNYWFFDKPKLIQKCKYIHLGHVTLHAVINLVMVSTLFWLDFIFVAFWY